jgi:hypothetical protein
MRRLPIVALGLLFACTAGPPDSLDGFGEVEGGEDEEASGSSGGEGSTGEPAPAADDADASTFDVGAPDLPAEGQPCDRVDMLFVIDNSASMADEQANLVASFPGFIAGIESILPSSDYHVGVITTDDNEYNGGSCQRIGALTTATGGEMSSDAQCGPYANGERFMTAADDLEQAFSCAAQVGVDGDGVERPMDAIAAALRPSEADLGKCNEWFLRDDALLVLVLITDEEDGDESVGDPESWRANLVAAKGDEENVVVLSLVGHDKPNACIPEQWDGMAGAEIAPRLIEFTQSLPHGLVGDVCAPSYAEFFEQGIAGIADACSVVVG